MTPNLLTNPAGTGFLPVSIEDRKEGEHASLAAMSIIVSSRSIRSFLSVFPNRVVVAMSSPSITPDGVYLLKLSENTTKADFIDPC